MQIDEYNQIDMPELHAEKIYHADPYVTCAKNKGKPRKHIAVCNRCRWKKKCRAYQLYWQPELPFVFTKPQPG